MNDPQPLEPVSIEASLTDSGASIQSQSRFISAVDRLFGGLFAWPAAYVDGRISKKKLLDEIGRKEIEAKADLKLHGELRSEELRIAVEYMRQRRDAESVLNLTAVTALALNDLREEKTTDNDNKSDEPISDDWINWFRDFAEKASSDEVRTLWGKILSGEAKAPGRFSIGTLRTLAEIDQRVGKLFQKHVDHLLWEKYIVQTEELRGEILLELTELEDAGLLREVNGMMGFDQHFDDKGVRYFEEGNAVLELGAPEGTKFRLSVILLSRAGRELFSLLPQPAPETALRKIVDVAPASVASAKLGVVASRTAPNEFEWITTEVLRA